MLFRSQPARADDGEFYVAGECRVLQSVIRQNDIDAGVSMQERKAGLITCTADRNRRHGVAGDEERFVPHFPRIRFGRHNLDFFGLVAKAAGDDAGGPAASSKLPYERNRNRRFTGAPNIDVALLKPEILLL